MKVGEAYIFCGVFSMVMAIVPILWGAYLCDRERLAGEKASARQPATEGRGKDG